MSCRPLAPPVDRSESGAELLISLTHPIPERSAAMNETGPWKLRARVWLAALALGAVGSGPPSEDPASLPPLPPTVGGAPSRSSSASTAVDAAPLPELPPGIDGLPPGPWRRRSSCRRYRVTDLRPIGRDRMPPRGRPRSAGRSILPRLPTRPRPRAAFPPWFRTRFDPPLGFTGPSSVLPREAQQDSHFVPVEDRWRIGFPEWDRYGKGHPLARRLSRTSPGRMLDPFNQNVLKGDYPIIGQHTFLDVTAHEPARSSRAAQVPTADDAVREHRAARSRRSSSASPNQFFYHATSSSLSFDLFHGDAAFKPVDWRVKLTPIFNVNHLVGRGARRRQPERPPGARTRTRDVLRARGVVRRDEARRPQPRLRLRLGPGSARSRSSATSAASSSPTSTAACASSARATPTATSSTSPTSDQPEKDTNSELNTFDDRAAEHGHRQLLPAGLHLARLHGAGQRPLQPRPAERSSSTRTTSWSGPTRSASSSRTSSTSSTSAGPATGTSTASTSRTQFYWVLGRDSLNPMANRRQDDQRPDGRGRAVVRPRLGAVPHVVLLGLRRRRHRTTATPPASTRSSTTRTSPAASSATGSGSRSGSSASTWCSGSSLVPDLRSSKIQGQTQLRQPGPAPGQRRRRRRPDAEAAS